jgi:hypothetical protein
MAQNYKSKSNVENLTDKEINDVIRYLEPKPKSMTQLNDRTVLAISVGLLIAILGLLLFIWLYP